MTTQRTKNWPATQAFETDAKTLQQILEAAAQAVKALRFDEVSQAGERTQEEVDAINNIMGHAQLLCEAMAALDSGKLVREQL